MRRPSTHHQLLCCSGSLPYSPATVALTRSSASSLLAAAATTCDPPEHRLVMGKLGSGRGIALKRLTYPLSGGGR